MDSSGDTGPAPTTWRTFWLLLGFAVVVGIGVVTVLVPELKDQSNDESSGSTETGVTKKSETPRQE